ncbi:hypothetical protein HOLleu_29913 [Holothuria leucospilota]|uniref:Uncharacterized protein n=1 Tax=Holothuria leucospilota TaxID=206669 RepID=A0A9Q1BJL3_HOLLE|nr:hypothetical protein HOLleu_29913 [Holothuria leucospilota]
MLLIGSDVPEAFWVMEERRGRRKEPFAIRSLLGWTLMGPVGPGRGTQMNVHHVRYGDDLLSQQVAKFWETDFGDSVFSEQRGESQEDRRARGIMEDSVRIVEGHYELKLPWRYSKPSLPNNRVLAETRSALLKRRLEKNPEMREKYTSVIDDYVSKGYARLVSHVMPNPVVRSGETEGIDKSSSSYQEETVVWYLPHHPVTHPQKPGKLRVVFDCAARFKGQSLNDYLLQGPDNTNSLVGVLLRFRQHPLALVSDIEAMFHQDWGKFPKAYEIESVNSSLEGDPEVKSSIQVCSIKVAEINGVVRRFIERYPTWSKLRKGVAWMLRFMMYLQAKLKGTLWKLEKGLLTEDEIRRAEIVTLKVYLKSENSKIYITEHEN